MNSRPEGATNLLPLLTFLVEHSDKEKWRQVFGDDDALDDGDAGTCEHFMGCGAPKKGDCDDRGKADSSGKDLRCGEEQRHADESTRNIGNCIGIDRVKRENKS